MQVYFHIPVSRFFEGNAAAVIAALTEASPDFTRASVLDMVETHRRLHKPVVDLHMSAESFTRFLVLRHEYGGANMWAELGARIGSDDKSYGNLIEYADAFQGPFFDGPAGKTAAMNAALSERGFYPNVREALIGDAKLRVLAIDLLTEAVGDVENDAAGRDIPYYALAPNVMHWRKQARRLWADAKGRVAVRMAQALPPEPVVAPGLSGMADALKEGVKLAEDLQAATNHPVGTRRIEARRALAAWGRKIKKEFGL